MKHLIFAALVLAAPVSALAQGADHSHGEMSALPPPGAAPSTPAYEAAAEKMHAAMLALRVTGNEDADFASAMLPHHQGAIDLARVELRYGRDPALRGLAQDIVAAQTAEIGRIQAWQKAHPAPAVPGAMAASPLAAAEAKMHAALDLAESGEADRDFATAMIPHHQGAIDMAQIELRDGTDPDLHDLSRAIVAAQQAEIARMQAWLAAHPRPGSGK